MPTLMRGLFRIYLLECAILAGVCPRALNAQNASPPVPAAAVVRYTISLADAPKHIVDVKLDLAPGDGERDLQLPVWNALYQIRDFSRYVNWIHAKGARGNEISLQALDKSRWHVSHVEQGAVIEYQILADVGGPFGAQVNADHAFFNLAEILMYPVNSRASPRQVQFVHLPSNWKIATALPEPQRNQFIAKNYDQLVDSPVEIGNFKEYDFDEGGGRYRVVIDADPSDYVIEDILTTLKHIVVAAVSWMDDRPFNTYLFIYHFPRHPSGGGMEHADSTAIDISAHRLRENPRALADVTAHEFFHLWNVKRIRPQSLEPIDYTRENYSRALWFSEGVTSTAALYFRFRSGLTDESSCLKSIADQIGEFERRAAHRTQSVEESSLDAWLEKYDDYDRPERSISYYNKGFLLGILLDLRVREASTGTASLRDIFHWMNEHYAKQGRFFPDSDGVREAAEIVSHSDLKNFFERYIGGTDEIPWNDFFKTVGLQLVSNTRVVAYPGFSIAEAFGGLPTVSSVAPDSDGARAGLAVGDTILKLNGQVPSGNLGTQIGALLPGGIIQLRVRNDAGEHDLQWTLGSRDEIEYELKDTDGVTAEQKVRRTAWLRGESEKTESEKSGDSRP
ncbi:MAG: PDZ domain-containing protein [Terriglobales bacterium]